MGKSRHVVILIVKYFTTLDEICSDYFVFEITLSLLWCLDVQKLKIIRDHQLNCILSFGDTSYKSSRIQPQVLLILHYFNNYHFSQLFRTSFSITLKVIFVTNIAFFDGFTQDPVSSLRKLSMFLTKICRKKIKFLWSR